MAAGTVMVGMTAVAAPLLASSASAAPLAGPFTPVAAPGTGSTANEFTTEGPTPESCNGIIPTPGSAPAHKFIVGKQATYTAGDTIEFGVYDNPSENGGTDNFTINDCVAEYAPGTTFPAGDIDPTTGAVTPSTGGEFKNPTAVLVEQALAGFGANLPQSSDTATYYTWTVPTGIPAGSIVCNFVKDTRNDHGGGGNRKAGVCFNIALASPTIGTQASPVTGATGATASDTATVGGFVPGANPQGTVTFDLWAPGTCGTTDATPVYTHTADVAADGTALSGTSPILATAGTYEWTASFSGDASNNPVSEGCGGQNEQTTLSAPSSLPTPTISTTAAGGGVTGTATASDTANLGGFVPGADPQGTVTFDLWAPGTCGTTDATPVYTHTADVASDGSAHSGTSPILTTAGTYEWTASFSGDASNNPVSEGCGGQNEQTVATTPTVTLPTPTISTTAAGGGLTGTATASDTANLGGFVSGADPQGTVTFDLWAPGTCGTTDATPVYTHTADVASDGSAHSGTSPTLTTVGTYEWTASFSGDAKNNPVSEGCGGQNEQTTVGAIPVVVTPTAPGLTITKSVNLPTLVAPGELTYTVVVSNPGTAPALNAIMTDANPPNTLFESLSQSGAPFTCTTPAVNTAGTISCTTPSLAAGASTTFTIVDEVTAAAAGTTVINTAVVAATGLTPPPATATTVIPVPPVTAPSSLPELTITKSVNVPTLVAPGELTYTVVVSNPGDVAATDVTMNDANPPNTLFESLSQSGAPFTCTTPAVNTAGTISCTTPSLAAGASTTFTIVDEVTSAAQGTTVVNTAVAAATGLTPPPASAQTKIPVPPLAVLGTSLAKSVSAPVTQAATLPLTGAPVRNLMALGIGLILAGLALFAKSMRMKPARA